MRKIVIIMPVLALAIVVLYIYWNQGKRETSVGNNLLEQKNKETSDNATDEPQGFIENLRQRSFEGGKIKIEENLATNNFYSSYIISYPSDDLTIYGMMNIPEGDGPFPVVVLNHGYFNTSSFTSGDGTQAMADILARNGYLTLASDYRGHGRSENDEGRRGGHRPEYAIDVLNLIASVYSIEKADTQRIGMWGHSMGGEVSLRTIEATDKIKALALWAPTSGNALANHAFYGGRQNQPTSSPEIEGTSPINYLQYILTPISLHQGLADIEVNPEWSKELNEALKNEGKSVEYFEYEGQDHNFRNLGWDLISERTIEFYDRYLRYNQ